LQDLTQSTPEALEIASKVFRLSGAIYPITTDNIQLKIEYQSGQIEIGERNLDEPKHGGERIVGLSTLPKATIYHKAKQSILDADMVIIGPGDLYGSLLSNLVVDGVAKSLQQTRAKLVYIQNLMTHYAQTHDLTATDHLKVIEHAIGRTIDVVVINSAPISPELDSLYSAQNEFPVIDDLDNVDNTRIIRSPLITTAVVTKDTADDTARSYLRHDSAKLAQVLINLIVPSESKPNHG